MVFLEFCMSQQPILCSRVFKIKRNDCGCWCCRLWRGITRRLCLSVCLKTYYTFRITPPLPPTHTHIHLCTSCIQSMPAKGVEIQGHRDFWFPPRCRIYLKLCLKVKTYTPKWKSHCWSVSPPCSSLFPFTKEASFFLCITGGLWDYQGTPVPWGKFPCSL